MDCSLDTVTLHACIADVDELHIVHMHSACEYLELVVLSSQLMSLLIVGHSELLC